MSRRASMRASVGGRVKETYAPIAEVRLVTGGGQEIEFAEGSVLRQEERDALVGHFTARYPIATATGRGPAQRIGETLLSPGSADHLHEALSRLRSPFIVLDVEDADAREVTVLPERLRFASPTMQPSAYRVGRVAAGTSTTCVLRRARNGRVVIEPGEQGVVWLDATEARVLSAHFRIARGHRTGGERDGAHVTVWQRERPGTVDHFIASLYVLPPPFVLLGVHGIAL